MKNIRFIGYGIIFSIILIKSEAISWYRIYEMFHFQSFHMYGLLFSGIVVALIGLKFLGIHTIPKDTQLVANVLGGISFGIGWGITGACTGPIFSLIGLNLGPNLLVLLGALTGTVLYAGIRNKIPHSMNGK